MGANQSSQPHTPILALPARASLLEFTFQPALDYDRDSCYPAPAISASGTLNPGLPLGGRFSEGCHLPPMLSNANVYSRSRCNGEWCGIVYDVYFQKDQSTEGAVALGHVHDIEHIVAWVHVTTSAPAKLEYVSTSAHGNYQVHETKHLFFDDGAKRHAKIVYHKDGGLTHAFRKAKAEHGGECEPAENDLKMWQYPALVGWEGWPSVGFRNMLTGHDFGKANLAIKNDRFVMNLEKAMPRGIAFTPAGKDEFTWEGKSPETGELKRALKEEPVVERDEL
jgi:necrosis inducing protein (NPP1)